MCVEIINKCHSLLKDIKHRFELFFETDLKRAVRQKEFIFHYQPQIDLQTGKILGVEALLRWAHPKKGMMNPAEFIPALERTGLINELTDFIFHQTMIDLIKLHELGFSHLFMAVNLSMVQLENPKLSKILSRQLKKTKLSPCFYECEVTETMKMKNANFVISTLQSLNKVGIKIAVDDFGSGYAGFNYLRILNIQKMKIDMSFIATLFEHPDHAIVLASMIQLGKQLGLDVVCEGIETQKQEKWLKKQGSVIGQGFLFSRPLPFPELVCLLKNSKVEKNG